MNRKGFFARRRAGEQPLFRPRFDASRANAPRRRRRSKKQGKADPYNRSLAEANPEWSWSWPQSDGTAADPRTHPAVQASLTPAPASLVTLLAPVMEHGTNCHLSTCLSLSFLPLTCPFCRHLFCESHFLPVQHSCDAPGSASHNNVLSETELLKRVLRANSGGAAGGGGPGDSSSGRRLPCQKSGCKRFSLHVDSEEEQAVRGQIGSQPDLTIKDAQSAVFKHKAPTCTNCHALFCVAHLAPRNHQCTAAPPPTEGQQRMQAADERKRKAREILAKNFPARKG